MSNIAPQKPKLNRRLWAKIERFVRLQARKYGKISVITGVCGSNGTLGKKRHNINIPKWWYKIIFLPNGKTIGFLVPNTNTGMNGAKAKEFLVDVREIEEMCRFYVKNHR